MAVKWSSGYTTQFGAILYVGAETYVSGSSVKIVVYWKLASGSSLYVSHAKLAVSGSTSYSAEVAINGAGTASRWLWERTITVARKYGSAVNGSFTVTLSGYGGSTTVTVPYSVPALPYNTPAKATNLTAVKVSSTQAKVTWQATSTTAAPISNFRLAKAVNDGAWEYHILAANVRSYTDTALPASGRVRYAVQPYNKNATADYVYSNYIYSTLFAPSGFTAERSGLDVALTWQNVDDYANRVEIWDNDSVLVATVAVTPGTYSSYTVKSPDTSITHSYHLQATLNGARSPATSKIKVTLLAPPLAPTSLTPNGEPNPKNRAFNISWVHNSKDNTAQTRFEVQIRGDETEEWVSLEAGEKYSDTSRSREAALTNTGSLQSQAQLQVKGFTKLWWRVRTWGQHAEASPWSNPAVTELVEPPTIKSLSLEDPSPVESSTLTVTALTDDEPYYYEFVLTTGAGDVVDTKTGYAPEGNPKVTFTGLVNGSSYTVSAVIRDRVKSDAKTASFKVQYSQPLRPTVNTWWDTQDPTKTYIQITGMLEGTEKDAKTVNVTRVLPDGTERVVAENLKVEGGTQYEFLLTDYAPALAGVTKYNVTVANSLKQTITVTSQTSAPRTGLSAVLSTADNTISVRARWNPEYSESLGLEYVEPVYMLGRTLPVMFASPERARSMKVEAIIAADEPEELNSWRKIAYTTKPLLYRDPSGTYIWVMLTDINLDYDRGYHSWKVSCSLNEVSEP